MRIGFCWIAVFRNVDMGEGCAGVEKRRENVVGRGKRRRAICFVPRGWRLKGQRREVAWREREMHSTNPNEKKTSQNHTHKVNVTKNSPSNSSIDHESRTSTTLFRH